MGRRGDGVEIRDASIRLNFVFDGAPVRETLRVGGKPMAPTPANVTFARKLAQKIRDKIALGTFTWAEFFPESAHARVEAEVKPATFGALAGLYLDAIGGLGKSTQSQYKSAVKLWRELLGEHTLVEDVTHKLIAAKVGRHPWSSAKQFNNYMIALRGILALEYAGPRAMMSPAIGIENKRVPRRLPDPLTADERDRILADLRAHYDERIYAYFLWQFYTGMRPEETIALRWSDVDTAAGTIRVQRVRTFKGTELDETKTKVDRDVDLLPQAMEALRIMRPHTFMLRVERDGGDDAADIFQRPAWHPEKGSRGGKPSPAGPWHDERSQRDQYWRPSLKRLGIRWRRPYNSRHTFATVALMAGVPPAYIAAQLGHSITMLLTRYARWVPGGDSGSARRQLAQALSGSDSSPKLPQNPTEDCKLLNLQEKSGRRDWTRTKKEG